MTGKNMALHAIPVLLAALLVAGLFFLFFGERGSSVVNGGLVVDERSLDWGFVWLSDSVSREIELTNPTHEDIRILDFKSSCACTSIEPRSLLVPAKGTASIELTLDVTPRRLTEVESPTVPFAVRLLPVFQQFQGRQPGWTIQCVVRNAFTVAPYGLAFGGCEAIVPGQESPGKDLIVQCNYPGLTIIAETPPEFGHTDVRCTRETEGSSTWIASVTPANELPIGPFDFCVRLKALDYHGHEVACTAVPVRGEIVSDVDALPSVVRLGQSIVGDLKVEDLLVYSKRGAILDVETPRTECTWLRVSRLPQRNDSRVRFQINAEVRDLGFQTGSVAFPIRGREIPLLVQITYFGVSQ